MRGRTVILRFPPILQVMKKGGDLICRENAKGLFYEGKGPSTAKNKAFLGDEVQGPNRNRKARQARDSPGQGGRGKTGVKEFGLFVEAKTPGIEVFEFQIG